MNNTALIDGHLELPYFDAFLNAVTKKDPITGDYSLKISPEMSGNNVDLIGGNPPLPYFDKFIDAVTVYDAMTDSYYLRTNAGGGGGGNVSTAGLTPGYLPKGKNTGGFSTTELEDSALFDAGTGYRLANKILSVTGSSTAVQLWKDNTPSKAWQSSIDFWGTNTYSVDYYSSGVGVWKNKLLILEDGRAGIGVDTTLPSPIETSAKLQIDSTSQGVLFPRMTTVQKNLIAAVAGLVVYDTTTNKLCCYNGIIWNDLF